MARPLLLALSLVLVLAPLDAAGQDDPPHAGYPPSEPVQVPRWAHPEPEGGVDPDAPHREGFTLYLGLGVGYQGFSPSQPSPEVSEVALAGLNLGIGGFLRPDLALEFRISGTTAFLDEGVFESVTSVSGVGVLAVQYWPVDALRVEAGVGFGIHNYEYRFDNVTIRSNEAGLGLLLAVAAAFWQNANHSLLLGIDYAPAFVEDGPAHNLGFTFGWQLH